MKKLIITKIEEQEDRLLLYGADPAYSVLAPADQALEVGNEIEYTAGKASGVFTRLSRSMKYDDLASYPGSIQPVVKVLLAHEKELTAGYAFNDFTEDDNQEVIKFLTEIATQVLTETKTILENQIPMWRYKNGQFAPNQAAHS